MECTIYLTEACNMQCSYCYEGVHDLKTSMSLTTMEDSVDFIVKQNYPGDKIDIVFLGGEPLLNKKCLYHAIEWIEKKYPKEKELFHYSITTNGTLIDNQLIDFLNRHHFQVSVSIDGNKETHNLNRIASETTDIYEIVLNNLRTMINRKLDVSVRMTVTANNSLFLSENIMYFLNLGVEKIHVGLDMLADWDKSALLILDDQLEMVDEIYQTYIEPYENRLIDIYDYKLSTFIIKRKPMYCSAGTQNHLVIRSNGEVYPCGYVTGNYKWKLGTIYHFEPHKIRQLICNHINPVSSCNGCPIAFACCGAKCGFLNWVKTGRLNKNHRETCEVQKILFKHNYKVIKKLYQQQSFRILKILHIVQKEKLEFSDIMGQMIESTRDESVQYNIGIKPDL